MTARAGRRPVPAGYQLRVNGHLGDHWSPWFDQLTVTRDSDGTTSLSGLICDQAQLHGLLTRIRDLGLTLISLRVIDPADTADHKPEPVNDQNVTGEDNANPANAGRAASHTGPIPSRPGVRGVG